MSYNLTKLDDEYDEHLMLSVFADASWVVASHRLWFKRQRYNFPLHPIVDAALRLCRPADWHLLLLEWPHKAESDPFKIAYTRDERAGEADRVVLTTMGRYLMRHFPTLPDHYVRDLVALHSPLKSDMYFARTVEDIVHGVQHGPKSCMSWEHETVENHPYSVYDPKYGWHLALRREADGVICGRCLCCEDAKGKRFVRSYKRDRNGGYSHADEQLEAWLKAQGYEKDSGWNGSRFVYIERRNGYHESFLAPYLDGEEQGVRVGMALDGGRFLHIVEDSEAEFTCNTTSGEPDEASSVECEHCGASMHEDEGTWAGYHEDTRICQHCADNSFVYGYGRNGHEYYFHTDHAIEVNGNYYHESFLHDHGIVCDVDGDYQERDDCIYVERNGEWYPDGDSRIVCKYNNEHDLRDECIYIEGEWYHDVDDADLIAQAQSKAEPLEETSIDE
jgi:hypothetical protein